MRSRNHKTFKGYFVNVREIYFEDSLKLVIMQILPNIMIEFKSIFLLHKRDIAFLLSFTYNRWSKVNNSWKN